jgi:hypothetical protein
MPAWSVSFFVPSFHASAAVSVTFRAWLAAAVNCSLP